MNTIFTATIVVASVTLAAPFGVASPPPDGHGGQVSGGKVATCAVVWRDGARTTYRAPAESLDRAKTDCEAAYCGKEGADRCDDCSWIKAASTYKCNGEVWCEKGDKFRAYEVRNRKEEAESAPQAVDQVVKYVQDNKAPDGYTCHNHSLVCEQQ